MALVVIAQHSELAVDEQADPLVVGEHGQQPAQMDVVEAVDACRVPGLMEAPLNPARDNSPRRLGVSLPVAMAGLGRPEAHRESFVLARPCSRSDDT